MVGKASSERELALSWWFGGEELERDGCGWAKGQICAQHTRSRLDAGRQIPYRRPLLDSSKASPKRNLNHRLYSVSMVKTSFPTPAIVMDRPGTRYI